MTERELAAPRLRGSYRDVLRDGEGRVVWDSDWRSNIIVEDCRRLLAGLLGATPPGTLGLQGLQVGAGLAAWDQTGAPLPDATVTALADPNPHTVPRAAMQIDFLAAGVVSGSPTNRLQIVTTLGPGVPPWPNATHASSTLREFALVGQLNGAPVLINCVRHPAIVKDPASSLDRTIWLVF